MKRLFLILAMLAAMVSGWTPALAATQQAGMSGAHAAHDAYDAGPAQQTTGSHGHVGHGDSLRADAPQVGQPPHEDHRDGQKHGALHPLLCSACFAVVAESDTLPAVGTKTSGTALPVAIFRGGEVLPPVPPPRPVHA